MKYTEFVYFFKEGFPACELIKDKTKERSSTRRRIRNVCVRQGFPFRRILGLEPDLKYGAES